MTENVRHSFFSRCLFCALMALHTWHCFTCLPGSCVYCCNGSYAAGRLTAHKRKPHCATRVLRSLSTTGQATESLPIVKMVLIYNTTFTRAMTRQAHQWWSSCVAALLQPCWHSKFRYVSTLLCLVIVCMSVVCAHCYPVCRYCQV